MLWNFFQDTLWPLADPVSGWQNSNVPSVLPSLSHAAEWISRQQICDALKPSWNFCMELLKVGVVCPWYSPCSTRRKQKQSPFRQRVQKQDLALLWHLKLIGETAAQWRQDCGWIGLSQGHLAPSGPKALPLAGLKVFFSWLFHVLWSR